MIAKQRIYLTADKSKAVAHGDRTAAFLLVGEGSEVDPKDAAKYGIMDGRLPAPGAAPSPSPAGGGRSDGEAAPAKPAAHKSKHK
jgi:hypothetical protein